MDSRKRRLFGLVFSPIGWGLGTAIVAYLGYLPVDVLAAFLLGFIVGLVHDLVMDAMHTFRMRNNLQDYLVLEQQLDLALSLFEKEEYESSLDILNQLLLLTPDHKRALYYSATILGKLGHHDRQLERLNEYLRLVPGDIDANDMRQKCIQILDQGNLESPS